MNRQNLEYIAEKIKIKKGVPIIVNETKINLPNQITFLLRGGYKKNFQIIGDMVYEDSKPYIAVSNLI